MGTKGRALLISSLLLLNGKYSTNKQDSGYFNYKLQIDVEYYLCPVMFICRAIHLSDNNRINATQMFGQFVVGWLEGLAMPTPRGIDLACRPCIRIHEQGEPKIIFMFHRLHFIPPEEHPLTHPRQFHQSYFQPLFSHLHHSTTIRKRQ